MKNNLNRVYAAFIAIFAIASFFISCNNNDQASVRSSDIDSSKLARGEYLANYVCGCIDCHSQRDYTKFSGLIVPGSEGKGGEVFNEIYAIPGVVFARNITPDTVNGIGNWTDEDLVKAMTRGIKKTGIRFTRSCLTRITIK
jgi:hypothetical protein